MKLNTLLSVAVIFTLVLLESCNDESDNFSGPTAKALEVKVGSGFNNEELRDVSIDHDGNMYVSAKTKIYKLDASGAATLFAGSNTAGITDGQGTTATFKNIGLMSFDTNGNIYVVDSLNIRKIDRNQNVTTIVIEKPYQMEFTPAPPFNSMVLPVGDQFFVAEVGAAAIFRVEGNAFNLFAGDELLSQGFVDGRGTGAKFLGPSNIILDETGNNLVVADWGSLRKISIADSTVSTFTGSDKFGKADGTLATASYQGIDDLVVDKNGNYYLSSLSTVRKISKDGQVTTIAGPIKSDGGAFTAGGLAVDREGNYLYITELKRPATLIKIDLGKL